MAEVRKSGLGRRIRLVAYVAGAGILCVGLLLVLLVVGTLGGIPKDPPKIAGGVVDAMWNGETRNGKARQQLGALDSAEALSSTGHLAAGDLQYPAFIPDDDGLAEGLRAARDDLNRRFDAARKLIADYEAEKDGLTPEAMKLRLDAILEEYQNAWEGVAKALRHEPRILDPLDRTLMVRDWGFRVWLNSARSELEEKAGIYDAAGRWMETANRFNQAMRRVDPIDGVPIQFGGWNPAQRQLDDTLWEREAALDRKAGPVGWGRLAYRIFEREGDEIRDRRARGK